MKTLRSVFVVSLSVAGAVAGLYACVGDAPVPGTPVLDSGGQSDTALSDSSGDTSVADGGSACSIDAGGKQLAAVAYAMDGQTRGIAIDNLGNQLHVGVFGGTGFVGDASITSAGNGDMFAFKRAGNGGVLWAKAFGSTALDSFEGASVDEAGDFYVIGNSTSPSITIGKSTIQNPNGVNVGVIVKLSGADGSVIWAQGITPNLPFGNVPALFCVGIAGAKTHVAIGCHYASASVTYPLVNGSTNTIASYGGRNSLIAQIDEATGGVSAITQLGPAGVDAGSGTYSAIAGLDILTTGNVLASGSFSAPAMKDTAGNKPTISLSRVGSNADGWVAELDTKGNGVWAKDISSPDGGMINGINVTHDGTGGATIIGGFHGAVDLGSGPLVAPTGGNKDLFIAHLKNQAGPPDWHKVFGGPGDDFANAIGLDNCARTVASFVVTGAVTLDGVALPVPQQNSIASVYLKIDSAGNSLWAQGFTPPANSAVAGFGLATAQGDGRLFVVGAFNGAVDLGFGKVVQTGAQSPFLAVFAP